ncbi:DNA replication licensing factor MCM3, putative [Entamoeba histolytica HM-1:IMSS-B]|uniref:DNA replication licensing factor MCM3 n=8 Tax=Entamoeba TaxID=5758 RepID=MCM3_ENTH1|nr:DNA replication licensing factor MCM3, putative [Entamoeba nuttalli P19]XP_653372.1 DNA replication licensing factor MCM3 [Entamoeba histolytica HM-1:IMSS]Q24849.2 RecName: Full=DNA replication licensing factor MCM3; Short=EhMCM3 [Entamoeba histolytica HM-1:IMSS]EMD48204.1 DNA replication licensing factor MCM3, putative [Entamoeba histolytica KU27]EMH72243.1 DNA replication licensing factor MCM3, putative [Entamoeba histolytica HM-1:IMSS-B]EMS15308.1 DNA replication licensing factor MCM3, p|eukprot:XP_008855658.1 DNA replication licensing factor MCM3, putative [Entamoeba nuttalli P19]
MEGHIHHITPRNITASILQQKVAVQGIITKSSQIRPLLQTAVQFCPLDYSTHARDLSHADVMVKLSSKTPDGKPLELEPGLSTYKDFQTLVVQEMPESAPTGQMPRSVIVILLDQLVDKGKPGDRVIINGTLKALAGPNHSSTFKVVLEAENINTLQSEGPELTEIDKENIKKVMKEENPINLLSKSIAPSIYGHSDVKKAILLMLVGATPKIRLRSRVRGDIHVMLCGDPSTAKSQLLRYVMSIAPLAVSTNGRGATGVGLTAAVVNDPDTNQRTLEAGAMVLADRGIVCVDEFDKMSIEDRAAMHEVMEQQTVTVQKAGIHTALNARCSILAAANPSNGNYDVKKSPMENLYFPESLLSRFDLIFIILDSSTEELDRRLSQHVLKMHRHFDALTEQRGDDEVNVLALVDAEREKIGDAPVYQDTSLYEGEKLFTNKFIKKYVTYARNLPTPSLSESASETIADAYVKLRENERLKRIKHNFKIKTLPITARALDSLIRLAEAHARIRGSDTIDEIDAQVAVQLIFYAHFDENWEGNITTDIARKVREYLTNELIAECKDVIQFDDILSICGIDKPTLMKILPQLSFGYDEDEEFVYKQN